MRKLVLVFSTALAFAGCSRSPLNICIDDQMNAWAADNTRHQEWLKKTEKYRQDNPTSQQGNVMIGDIAVPRDLLGGDPFGSPPTEEAARASANLRCGKIYGKR